MPNETTRPVGPKAWRIQDTRKRLATKGELLGHVQAGTTTTVGPNLRVLREMLEYRRVF